MTEDMEQAGTRKTNDDICTPNSRSRQANVVRALVFLANTVELIDSVQDKSRYDMTEDELIEVGAAMGEIQSAKERIQKVFGVDDNE